MVTYKLAVRIKIELATRRLFQIYETTRALIRGIRLFVKVGGGGGALNKFTPNRDLRSTFLIHHLRVNNNLSRLST